MQGLFKFKNRPFHKRQKNVILRFKTEQFHHRFFFDLFHTATLIIPSFRMSKARGCKQSFKSDLFYGIYMQHYYTSRITHVPQQQYS